MFIGHAPAGYLLGAALQRHSSAGAGANTILAACVVGSVIPDLDLLWFYLVDDRQVVHHAYWPHLPAFWLAVAIVAVPAARAFGRLPATAAFFAGVLAHLLLDGVAGGIRWLAPFSDVEFVLFQVPSHYGWWVLNFVLHWSFALEVALVGAALAAHRARRRSGGAAAR